MNANWAAISLTALLCGSRLGAQAPIPVYQEPMHKLVLETGTIRVLDVQIPPGDTSLYHVHDAPILYIPISVSSADAQILGGNWIGLGPSSPSRFRVTATESDTLYAIRPITHRVTNVGTELFRLIAILNHRSNTVSPAERHRSIPGVAEHGSSWFFQTRLGLAPGESTESFASSSPLIIVQPGTGRTLVECETGEACESLEKPGSLVHIRAGKQFRLRNTSAQATTVVIVQVL